MITAVSNILEFVYAFHQVVWFIVEATRNKVASRSWRSHILISYNPLSFFAIKNYSRCPSSPCQIFVLIITWSRRFVPLADAAFSPGFSKSDPCLFFHEIDWFVSVILRSWINLLISLDIFFGHMIFWTG